MNQFFWSKNYLSYIRNKKLLAKHIYPKYLIRSIEIDQLKFLYIDDYSSIYIKFLKTEYALLWTQKLINIGNSYSGYHKTYKFYFDDLDPIIYIHWKKVNYNYASRLLKQTRLLIANKTEYLNNCLILRIKKGGFWSITHNILFFIRQNKIKKFTKKYLFNKTYILLKNTINAKNYLKTFSTSENTFNWIKNLLKLKEHTKLFLILYKRGIINYNNFFISPIILYFICKLNKYKKFFLYFKIIQFKVLNKLINNNYIFLNIKKNKLILLNPNFNEKYPLYLSTLQRKHYQKIKKNFLLNFSFKRLLNKNNYYIKDKKNFLPKNYYKYKYSKNILKIYRNQQFVKNKILKKYRNKSKIYKKSLH